MMRIRLSETLVLGLGLLILLPDASAQIPFGKRFRSPPALVQSLLQAQSKFNASTVPATPQLAAASVAAVGVAASVRKITPDIFEFDYIVPTGPGRYHSIGVHRVVRVEGGKPAVSHNAIFLAHGYSSYFDSFMGGTHSPRSLPVYLARNGIDVWGIDYGWTLVPSTETDFTFMQNWGLQRDIDDLRTALVFARSVRKLTGSDASRLTLLGHSGSVWTGFALVNEETQLSCPERQVKAWIPSDEYFNTNEPQTQSVECAGEVSLRQFLAQGFYSDNTGQLYQQVGTLVLTDPNGPSPAALCGSPYTNLQCFLVLNAATWQLGTVVPPFGHYYAGIFGPGGITTIPTGFRYTEIHRAVNQLIESPPFQPILQETEGAAIVCGDAPPQFSDHLHDVRIPVFYLGAAGGTGRHALSVLGLLGSDDTSHYIVSFFPPDQEAFDFAHIDLYDAENAQDVVWNRILTWVLAHTQDIECPAQ